MTSAPAQLPQLELVHRMLELPVIELALSKSASTYARLKDSHQLVSWALRTAESSLTSATRQAAPYAKRLEAPISYVDHTLCRGLDQIERKVPIVREKPELILENAYMMAVDKLAYATIQAINIKDMSWNKVNQILSTHYGMVAVNSLDNTAILIEILIDKYFPPMSEETFSESVSAEDDKLLHTLQTVGRLSNKAARRVYSHAAHQLRTLSKDNLRAYLSNLVEFLQVARFVNATSHQPRNGAVPSPQQPGASAAAGATDKKDD